jgi:hypothetical protein
VGLLQATQQPFLRLCNEQLVAGGERTRLLEFLDLPQPAPSSSSLRVRSIRQNPSSLPDLVANFDELEAALAGTALAADLRSP